MFKFLLDSEYRKLYNELQGIELFNNNVPIRVAEYQQYFHHLVIIDPSIINQLEAIPLDKLTPVRCVKLLVFVHCWLQATCVIEDCDGVMNFLGKFLVKLENLTQKTKKARGSSKILMTQSAVQTKSDAHFKQLQASKQLFLLEQICRPYLLYLQKLISRFDFYNSLKKNFIKPMSHSEIWVLINLFHGIGKVITNVGAICKFIRKSYRPMAESLVLVFNEDIVCFYPKMYKYCYAEVNRLRSVFFEVENEKGEAEAYLKCVEGVDLMVNLLVEVEEVNSGLKKIYDQPVVLNMYGVYVPKMVETQGAEFQFVRHLERIKIGGYSSMHPGQQQVTPKFRTLNFSRRTQQTEKTQKTQECEVHQVSNFFRDITNSQITKSVFQKQTFTVPIRKRQIQESQRQHKRVLTLGKPVLPQIIE